MSATALPPSNETILQKDATNRAFRTFIQGFFYDLVAAIAVWVIPLISGIETWDDFEWTFIGLMLLKTVVVTFISYFMRKVADGSGIPTPLPPSPVVPPSDPVEPEYIELDHNPDDV